MYSIPQRTLTSQTLDTKIKVIIPVTVNKKIKYLNEQIPKLEWSGLLFYTYEGSISKPELFIITLQDVFPMDKGTVASTSYKFDKDVVNYMMNNPEADSWNIGHIHSHNSMNTFFSGTDMAELETNSVNHNFYLSFITNNAFENIAKVTYYAETFKKGYYKAKDGTGSFYQAELQVSEETSKVMFIHDCQLVYLNSTESIDNTFLKRAKEIILKPSPMFTHKQLANHEISKANKEPAVNRNWLNNFFGTEDVIANSKVRAYITKVLCEYSKESSLEFCIRKELEYHAPKSYAEAVVPLLLSKFHTHFYTNDFSTKLSQNKFHKMMVEELERIESRFKNKDRKAYLTAIVKEYKESY